MAEAAEEGDEEALEELRAERVEAIESMIEALQDEDARQMIGLGIMLEKIAEIDVGNSLSSGSVTPGLSAGKGGHDTPVFSEGKGAGRTISFWEDSDFDSLLDGVEEQLEGFLESSPAIKD